MLERKIDEFVKGWLVGNFSPALVASTEIEVGVKWFKKGESEPPHFQRVAIEHTLVVSGRCRIGGDGFREGDIVTINPGELADFVAESDCVVLAIKTPSLPDDKVVP